MGLKNNKKGFDWRTMLKCMVRRFLYMRTNKISIYVIVLVDDRDYNDYIKYCCMFYSFIKRKGELYVAMDYK